MTASVDKYTKGKRTKNDKIKLLLVPVNNLRCT